MKEDKKLINFRISESMADDLREVSDRLEIPQSQIIREAVKEKITELKARVNAEPAVALASLPS